MNDNGYAAFVLGIWILASAVILHHAVGEMDFDVIVKSCDDVVHIEAEKE